MTDIEIKNVEPQTVAFVSMKGPYSQMPEAFGTLYGWVAQHGLEPVGMPGAVYLTEPEGDNQSEALWELQAPLRGSPSPPPVSEESSCGIRENPEMTVASVMHYGPYETVGETYEHLERWVAANGYLMAGPPQELYYSDPEEVPHEAYQTEIQFPIKKR